MKPIRMMAVVPALMLVLGLSACTGVPDGSGVPRAIRTLTLASVSDNNSFDPAALEIGHRVQYWMPVYDTLLVLDEDSTPRPNLATAWAYDDAETTLTLQLREDVTFTDGTPFDATAVQENLEHLAAGGGQNAYMAASIADVEIVDAHELRLVLSQRDPSLIQYLGTVAGAMASPASLNAPDIDTHPVGSGPYVLDVARTSAGSRYVYSRNDDYWNRAAFPYDEIVIKPMPSTTARLNALKSGQVDASLGTVKSVAEATAADLDISTTQVNWVGLVFADRAGTIVPALADVRVRRAISMAFDTEAILANAVHGQGELTDQIFHPTDDAYDPTLDGTYTYDPDAAAALLADAGYADGFDITMPAVDGYENYSAIIEQALGDLNITVEWVPVAPESAISSAMSGRYAMFFFQLGSQSAWQDIQKSVLPDAPWNPFGASDDELTSLIDTAIDVVAEQRTAAMRAVNAWLVEKAWFDPWYREDTVYLSNRATDVVMQSRNVVPWIRNFAPAA